MKRCLIVDDSRVIRRVVVWARLRSISRNPSGLTLTQ